MSTQAIRSVILRYKEALGDDVLPGQADAIRLAIEEVEAIEQAAEVLAFEVTSQVEFHNRQLTMAVSLMREIADDAPKHEEKP